MLADSSTRDVPDGPANRTGPFDFATARYDRRRIDSTAAAAAVVPPVEDRPWCRNASEVKDRRCTIAQSGQRRNPRISRA